MTVTPDSGSSPATLTCYADVGSLSSARGTVLDVLLSGGDSAGGKMLAVTDRPRHRELRTLMLRAFSPRVLAAVEQNVRDRASRLIGSVTRQGEFDFAAEVAEHPSGSELEVAASASHCVRS